MSIDSFNATLSQVWDAFTKHEILDQWWAPKPWASKTKYMNFEEGGQRFYAMVSPEGHERWAVQKYSAITSQKGFNMLNAFADKDENLDVPGSNWDFNFSEENGIAKVIITIKNDSPERFEKMLEMGFKEGFTMKLNNLDSVIATLK
ncbi:SRPBCC domain-containing protein [Flavobacterium qiangtangense]|uniref:SRPBCC domain-containing protein n=1 Tax=Flavobacterium qiangtangense TaxID=1442595 RepID=A0ABW1PIS9_9FLAO